MTIEHDLRGLTRDHLDHAAKIYLRHAYPLGDLPAKVLERLAAIEDPGVITRIADPPFERSPRDGVPRIFSLRLGNTRYPHMKLQVQTWPTSVGFLFSVNAHDQITNADPNLPGMAGFREIQHANQTLKQAIEHDWDQAGLPTFLRYLKDFIAAAETADGSTSASFHA